MSERMGNGAIQISITVYPDLDGGERYNKSVTRTINIDHLGGLPEMAQLTYSLGDVVKATIRAIIDTLDAREQAAKNPPLVDDDEQAPEDEGPVVSANHVDAWA